MTAGSIDDGGFLKGAKNGVSSGDVLTISSNCSGTES